MSGPVPLRPRPVRCLPRLAAARAAAGLFVVAGLTVVAQGRADAPRLERGARPAGAEGAEGAAKVDPATLVRVGDRFRDRGDWLLAREAYAAAHAVGREPRILCEWGMAELALSAHDDAATYLDRCLKDPRAGTIEQRRRYLSGLEQARREVGQLNIEVSHPGTELFLDDESVGKEQPTAFYLYVNPGAHTLKASLPGFLDAARPVQVERGGVTRVDLRLEPTPPAASPQARLAPAAPVVAAGRADPASAPPGPFGGGPGAARICGIGMTTLGLAAGAVASVVASTHGAEAARRAGALRQRTSATICASPPSDHAAECAVIDDLYDTHDIARNVATGFFIGAGAVAAATLASFVHYGLEHRARPVRVAPVAGVQGAGVLVQGVW
ncbi:PEGA domain-containing protein [Sorangium sp. So ce118]